MPKTYSIIIDTKLATPSNAYKPVKIINLITEFLTIKLFPLCKAFVPTVGLIIKTIYCLLMIP